MKSSVNRVMKSETRHRREIDRQKLIDYLSDPNNKPLNRSLLAKKVLGVKSAQSLYARFDSAEMKEIEIEALEVKRKRYASHLSKVDDTLLKKAIAGDVNAIRLAYQRFEGWAPPKELKVKSDMQVIISKEDAGCL